MYGRKATKLLNMVRRFLGKEPRPASAPTGPGRGPRAEASKDQDLARKVYTPVQQAKRTDQGVAGRAGYAYDAGRRLHRQGRFKETLDAFKEFLELFRQVEGSTEEQASCLRAMGVVYGYLDRREEALDAYRQALDLYRQVEGCQGDQADCLYNVANMLRELGRGGQALPLFRQALEAYARLEDSEEEQADCLEAIGAIEAG